MPSSSATSFGNVPASNHAVDARKDVVADPLAHQIADLSLLLGEEVVDVQEIERIGSHHGPVA